MKIFPIVEGQGEVGAVPVLLRRILAQFGAYEVGVGTPIRRKRSEFKNEDQVRRAVRLALLNSDCGGVLVLFDSDDDCPRTAAPTVEAWAKAEATAVPCAVVMAKREYEAWFLGSMESLRGVRGISEEAISEIDPESVHSAKGRLESWMLGNRSYSPTADQAALSDRFDLLATHKSCRSFRRLTNAVRSLVQGIASDVAPWP